MTRWEYTTISLQPKDFLKKEFDEKQLLELLNFQGEQGWEVSGVIQPTYGGWTDSILVILKRPISS